MAQMAILTSEKTMLRNFFMAQQSTQESPDQIITNSALTWVQLSWYWSTSVTVTPLAWTYANFNTSLIVTGTSISYSGSWIIRVRKNGVELASQSFSVAKNVTITVNVAYWVISLNWSDTITIFIESTSGSTANRFTIQNPLTLSFTN